MYVCMYDMYVFECAQNGRSHPSPNLTASLNPRYRNYKPQTLSPETITPASADSNPEL